MVETSERTYSFGKLGRGLSSLIGEQPRPVEEYNEIENTGSKQVEIDRLKPSQYQPRTEFNAEALKELSDSIAKSGIIQPIVVRSRNRDEFEIIAGERRWRAAKMAGLQKVPVVIRQLSDREVIELALVENIQRRDLNPLEEAFGYRRLLGEFGYTQDDLSRVMGKSRSHIANLLRLLSLPEKVKSLITEEKLAMSHARALIGCDAADQIAQKIVDFGLSVRETEELVMQFNAGTTTEPEQATQPAEQKIEAQAEQQQAEQPRAKPKPVKIANDDDAERIVAKSADIMAIEEILSRNLNAFVDIRAKGKGGKMGEIRIKYRNLQELDNILSKFA